jgi:hypothetical protein
MEAATMGLILSRKITASARALLVRSSGECSKQRVIEVRWLTRNHLSLVRENSPWSPRIPCIACVTRSRGAQFHRWKCTGENFHDDEVSTTHWPARIDAGSPPKRIAVIGIFWTEPRCICDALNVGDIAGRVWYCLQSYPFANYQRIILTNHEKSQHVIELVLLQVSRMITFHFSKNSSNANSRLEGTLACAKHETTSPLSQHQHSRTKIENADSSSVMFVAVRMRSNTIFSIKGSPRLDK